MSGETPLALRHQPHDDVDVADDHALGRRRDAVDPDRVARNVHELAVLFDEEVVVVRRVGVEIGLAAVDGELAQKARLR